MWLAVTGPAHLTNGISWIEGEGLQGPLDVHFRHMLLKFGNSFFLTADQLSKRFHFFQNLFQLGFTFLLRKKKYKRKIKDNYLYIVFSFLLLFLFRIKWAFIRQVCSNKEFVVVFQELLVHTYMYTYSFYSHVIYVKVRGEVENEHIIIIHIGTKGDLCIYVLKNVTFIYDWHFFLIFFLLISVMSKLLSNLKQKFFWLHVFNITKCF